MDGAVLVRGDGTTLVDRLADNVNDSAESLGADGDQDGVAGVLDGLAADETFGGVEGDGAHVVATEMLGDLEHEAVLRALHFKSVENGGELTVELHIDDSTNNLRNLSVGRSKTTYSLMSVTSFHARASGRSGTYGSE